MCSLVASTATKTIAWSSSIIFFVPYNTFSLQGCAGASKKVSTSKLVIFSSAFVSSSCCLEEVEKIMEFHTTIGQIVLPVFYNVEQREVHRQSGTFGESFVKLSKKISATKEKELSWRRALTKAAEFKGWHLTDSLR
ncbi:hypothetical protein L6164_002950 [Bauhinia variegata]|uniref:Uncharacterized protein n=1 Tax=Bauhinia variegata TaxID=167791 RepID=A0ACB9Q5B3_BAUVA|nr:hypothetical protein L6164_002950 [Bauhinia variegata]